MATQGEAPHNSFKKHDENIKPSIFHVVANHEYILNGNQLDFATTFERYLTLKKFCIENHHMNQLNLYTQHSTVTYKVPLRISLTWRKLPQGYRVCAGDDWLGWEMGCRWQP